MKVICPEHELSYELTDDYELLIHGWFDMGFVSISWCQTMKGSEWYELIKKVIKRNPLRMCENLGVENQNPEFVLIDLIRVSDMCCCPERVSAYHKLNVMVGFDIIQCIEADIMDSEESDQLNEKFKKDLLAGLLVSSKSFCYFVLHDMIKNNDDQKNMNMRFLRKNYKKLTEI